MTIEQAFKHFMETAYFKDMCRNKDEGAKYRVYKGRFNKGKLDSLAMVRILIEQHYTIQVSAPKS